MRGRLSLGVIAAIGVAMLALGVFLWRRYGVEVWLEQAIAFCL